MKIETSNLNLESRHNYTEMYERKESLTISQQQGKKDLKNERARDRVDLHRPPKWSRAHPKHVGKDEKLTEKEDDITTISDMKLRIMKMVIEEVTGKKIKVYDPSDSSKEDESEAVTDGEVVESGADNGQSAPTVSFDYHIQESYYERESLAFTAKGNVTTEDGREINFETSLYQSRELYQETNLSVSGEGNLIDPVVINFDGRGAQLSEDRVDFDLTANGNDESIAKLQSGSSFLALDRNGDGEINDGSELFGPTSGNGFNELRELDSDNNGWIDENDELFYDLKLWRPGEESSSLPDRRVGAIALDSVNGTFELRDSEQSTLGVVREQGVWLNEQTGQAGVIQEIDLMA